MHDNRSLYTLELQFFGKITASISHELNNVLSIINEYTGLLDDLSRTGSADNERIQKITHNICEQIKREQSLIKLLNRFSHRVDVHITNFCLNDLIQDIIRLSCRFADMKKVKLNTSLPEETISITNSPFSTQHALFTCIDIALDFSQADDCIHTVLELRGDDATVMVTGCKFEQNQECQTKLNNLSLIMQDVGGKYQIHDISDDEQKITLHIPMHVSSTGLTRNGELKNEHKNIVG